MYYYPWLSFVVGTASLSIAQLTVIALFYLVSQTVYLKFTIVTDSLLM
jgi:hypothetical protein